MSTKGGGGIVDKAKEAERARAANELRAAQQRHQLQVSSLEAALKGSEAERRDLRASLDLALGLGAIDVGTISPFKTPKREPRGLPWATFFGLASDWHMGERVRKSTVGGLNEYNPEIALARAQKYFRSLRTVLNVNRAAWNIEEMVLWLGGDFTTGYIHDEYLMENFLSPMEELIFVYETLVAGIKQILAEYDLAKLKIVTSNGNHGRGQLKKISVDFRTSYEYALYRLIAMAFKDEPRVEFKLSESYDTQIKVYDKVGNFHHGDEVKYDGGIGGVWVPLMRRIARKGVDLLFDASGHHHMQGYAIPAIKNGSLIGPTPFGMNKGFKPERPMQTSFVVDARHQVVSGIHPIFVE